MNLEHKSFPGLAPYHAAPCDDVEARFQALLSEPDAMRDVLHDLLQDNDFVLAVGSLVYHSACPGVLHARRYRRAAYREMLRAVDAACWQEAGGA